MILPTMTPEEKHAQMKIVGDFILKTPTNKREQIYRRLSKSKVFPSYLTEEVDIPNVGRWTIVYEAESKSVIKKGIVTVQAYQKFYISHSKNPLNNGAGIYLFNAQDDGKIMCQEFPPHYFNRLRERLIEPKGIVQPDFPQLVKAMLRLHYHSMDVVLKGYTIKRGEDGMYSIERNNSMDRQEGYENYIGYHKEGISLGVSVNDKDYINFTTFVPNCLLHKEQIEEQKRMQAELREAEYKHQFDPFAVYSKREWVDIDKDV